MKASEDDRLVLSNALDEENRGQWRQLKSEIHYHGEQALFWFLIDDPKKIGGIVSLFERLTSKELYRFDETKFEISFIEIRDRKKIIWDVIGDEEIRGRLPAREWGSSPEIFALGNDEVFDLT